MFFNTTDFDLDHAAPGTLSLAPSAPMLDALERGRSICSSTAMKVELGWEAGNPQTTTLSSLRIERPRGMTRRFRMIPRVRF